MPKLQARLACVFGTADPLIPIEDREVIEAALHKADPATKRLLSVECAGAGHGFMCEARSSFDSQASAQGWRLLLGEVPVV